MIEIKRSYQVLPNNNIMFGIILINSDDFIISDVELLLIYDESFFELEGSALRNLESIPPASSKTTNFILKPLSIGENEINATLSYNDNIGKKHIIRMHATKLHVIRPFLKTSDNVITNLKIVCCEEEDNIVQSINIKDSDVQSSEGRKECKETEKKKSRIIIIGGKAFQISTNIKDNVVQRTEFDLNKDNKMGDEGKREEKKNVKKCPNCGSINIKIFCEECGTKVTSEENLKSSSDNEIGEIPTCSIEMERQESELDFKEAELGIEIYKKMKYLKQGKSELDADIEINRENVAKKHIFEKLETLKGRIADHEQGSVIVNSDGQLEEYPIKGKTLRKEKLFELKKDESEKKVKEILNCFCKVLYYYPMCLQREFKLSVYISQLKEEIDKIKEKEGLKTSPTESVDIEINKQRFLILKIVSNVCDVSPNERKINFDKDVNFVNFKLLPKIVGEHSLDIEIYYEEEIIKEISIPILLQEKFIEIPVFKNQSINITEKQVKYFSLVGTAVSIFSVIMNTYFGLIIIPIALILYSIVNKKKPSTKIQDINFNFS